MTRKDVIQEMTARTNEKYNEMLEAEGKLTRTSFIGEMSQRFSQL